MRLSMGLLAPQSFDSTLIGDESLMRRPMERVAAPLRLMGANIQTQNGRPPVEIRGSAQMRAIDYALPVASAQVKSAVLLAGLQAYGCHARVTEPAPTRDHTERMLRAFGVNVVQQGATASIEGGQTLSGTEIVVPAILVGGFLFRRRLPGSREAAALRNVGVNPTRTGLLELCCKWEPTSRSMPIRTGRTQSPSPTWKFARAV